MGSGESTTRKVSFGMDDEDRVRILRGVKLSEDVLQRMRGVANIPPERTTSPTSSPKTDTDASGKASLGTPPQQSPQRQTKPTSPSPKPASPTKEEQRRQERPQKTPKDEWANVTQKEKEATREEAMKRERLHLRQEVEKTKQLSADEIEAMALELEKKDSELKEMDTFYKEQLAQLEKRNQQRYQESKEQFHDAANKTEANFRRRNTDPVCMGLQAQILSCYRGSTEQTLKCSDLAKQYLQCINAAKQNLLINHG